MAEYGLLGEVRIDQRTTALTAAASISDTELLVDSAGDLAEDGGTLELNGVQLEYSGTVMGATEDDPDTIVLVEPLAAAADPDDQVTPVIGGLTAEDWYALVDIGGGDPVPVPLTFAQRSQWAPGIYDPPAPVTISEDLSRLEDAPGRPASVGSRTEAWNEDEWSAAGDNIDSPGALTYLPKPHSLTVEQNGNRLRNSEFTLVDRVVTPLADETVIRSGDRFTAYYDRDPAAEVVGVGTNLGFEAAVFAVGSPILWAGLGDTSGSTAVDLSTYHRNGTFGGSWTLGQPPIGPGLPGASTDFPGTGFVEFSPGASWQRPPNFSAMIWALPSTSGQFLFGCDDLGLADTDRIWNILNETAGRIYSGTTAAPTDAAAAIGPLVNGVPTMLLLTFDGTDGRFYKDGVLVQTSATPGAMNTSTLWPLTIGATANGQYGRFRHFDGLLQHAVMWDVVATPDQIEDLWATGMDL